MLTRCALLLPLVVSHCRRRPDDHSLFYTCARDTIKALRNHPSLLLWCGGNEQTPAPDLCAALAATLPAAPVFPPRPGGATAAAAGSHEALLLRALQVRGELLSKTLYICFWFSSRLLPQTCRLLLRPPLVAGWPPGRGRGPGRHPPLCPRLALGRLRRRRRLLLRRPLRHPGALGLLPARLLPPCVQPRGGVRRRACGRERFGHLPGPRPCPPPPL